MIATALRQSLGDRVLRVLIAVGSLPSARETLRWPAPAGVISRDDDARP